MDGIASGQQELGRLGRSGSQVVSEAAIVTSPGARAEAWAVEVKSLSSHNVYNVCAVEIGDAGSLPIEIGNEIQAYNLAESFTATGSLSAGTYALMCRLGSKNIFYAPV